MRKSELYYKKQIARINKKYKKDMVRLFGKRIRNMDLFKYDERRTFVERLQSYNYLTDMNVQDTYLLKLFLFDNLKSFSSPFTLPWADSPMCPAKMTKEWVKGEVFGESFFQFQRASMMRQ